MLLRSLYQYVEAVVDPEVVPDDSDTEEDIEN